MKTADAQIKVEPWNSAANAKGELQQAWFRVKGIPADQMAIKTIAKVGGLVGKTIDIDEKTRNRNDYARILLACRDFFFLETDWHAEMSQKFQVWLKAL